VFLLNNIFDDRKKQCCVMCDHSSWLVWNLNMVCFNFYVFDLGHIKLIMHSLHYEHNHPYKSFLKRRHYTILKSSQFLQMYIMLISQGKKCKLFELLYERCGILCSHVLKSTNEIEASMLRVQHWKIYPVLFGGENEILSKELMKLTSIQSSNKNMGAPILDASYQQCQQILNDWYVALIFSFDYVQFDNNQNGLTD
jgi:hypothetical protein